MKNQQIENLSPSQLNEQAEVYHKGLIGDRLHHLPKKRFVIPTRWTEDQLDELFTKFEELTDG